MALRVPGSGLGWSDKDVHHNVPIPHTPRQSLGARNQAPGGMMDLEALKRLCLDVYNIQPGICPLLCKHHSQVSYHEALMPVSMMSLTFAGIEMPMVIIR